MSDIQDSPAYQSMMEANARTHRVERVLAALTRPIYVWRFAKAKAHGKGSLARGAQTTYFNIVKEIDEILKKEYGAS